MRWPPNPWPSRNCLTSGLPELLWVSGCFQLRPCRAHILAALLRCVSWGDGPATPTLQIFLLCTRNRNQNGGSKQRQLMPGHRLCDKAPSHLKAVLITFFQCPDLCSCWLLYLQIPLCPLEEWTLLLKAIIQSSRCSCQLYGSSWTIAFSILFKVFCRCSVCLLPSGWYAVDRVLVISTFRVKLSCP